MTMVKFTPDKARRLKAAYKSAVAGGKEQFAFEGADYLTSYAKYVLEYLTQQGVLK